MEELSKHPFFASAIVATYRNPHWVLVTTDEPISDALTVTRFSGRQSSVKFKKYPNPWQVVFWAPKSNIAAIVNIPKKTQESTISHQHEVFINSINAATKSYYANHDTLTGVLNRHGLQWEFERLIASGWSNEEEGGEFDLQLPASNEITLFSFDIDKFKNINDTYGHDVGDAVLSIFASRIISILPDLEKKFGVSCTFGRPGGEEFELIVKGQAGLVAAKMIAEDILVWIRQPRLPGSEEIKRFVKKSPSFSAAEDLSLMTNGVTASIGVATQVITNLSLGAEKLYSSLRRDADLALYRAKADGRNCCRLFSDIRTCHGRVYRNHADSGLVIIDIGSNVGVEVSDLYRVFFPPFQNDDIRFEDERTSKILGKYPLIESARLIVIETQEKVATCAIIDCATSAEIPDGALLQYVHTGSVPFFHRRPRQLAYNMLPMEEIIGYIDYLVAENILFSIIKLSGRFKGDDKRERDRKVSEVAAVIHLSFPRGTKLFGGSNGGLYIVSRSYDEVETSEDDELEKLAEERKEVVKSQIESLSSCLENVRAGVYQPGEVGNVDLCAQAMLFYCNAALTAARQKNSNNSIVFFNEHIAGDAIYTWRKMRLIEDALVDYQQFKSYGFDTPALNNQLGLAILEARVVEYYSLGLMAFANAVKVNSEFSIYRANLALMHAVMGNYKAANKECCSIGDYMARSEINHSYLLAQAKCIIESIKLGEAKVDENVKAILSRVASEASSQNFVTYEAWRREVIAFFQGSEEY